VLHRQKVNERMNTCSIFNAAVVSSGYIASSNKMINKELGRTVREVAVACV
jgi:hypothetical protein